MSFSYSSRLKVRSIQYKSNSLIMNRIGDLYRCYFNRFKEHQEGNFLMTVRTGEVDYFTLFFLFRHSQFSPFSHLVFSFFCFAAFSVFTLFSHSVPCSLNPPQFFHTSIFILLVHFSITLSQLLTVHYSELIENISILLPKISKYSNWIMCFY